MLIYPKYINDPGKKPKWEPKYVGPYTVARRAQKGAYVLKAATGDLLDRHVPADQMKLISKSRQRKIDNSNPIYVINKVVSHRGSPETNIADEMSAPEHGPMPDTGDIRLRIRRNWFMKPAGCGSTHWLYWDCSRALSEMRLSSRPKAYVLFSPSCAH